MTRLAAAALALVAALALAAPALADGDPASDFLLTQKVFLPFDDAIPKPLQGQLAGLVAASNKAGYPIRVAVIGSSYDLGSIQSLWKRPRKYSQFLGVEISFAYKGPLLVAMPNGFGFNHFRQDAKAEQALVARIPVGRGGAGMARSTMTAVQRLAAAHGVHVVPPRAAVAAPSRTNSDRLHLVIGIVVLLVLAATARLLIHRRRRRPA
ncbi:MAG TPA: hypothetical protein VFL66_02020 [Gaiellaceae bacterium]|nr:hypothetical protein [Gaiellaceae bacterium]